MITTTTETADASGLCTSPACIHAASDILASLAINYTDIDPCTDFDEYVCGNWAAVHETPTGKDSTDALDNVKHTTYASLRRILESDYNTDAGWITVDFTKDQAKADKQNFAQLQMAYEACVNNTSESAESLETLLSFVEEVTSAFPASLGSGDKPKHLSKAMGDTLTLFETYGIATTQRILRDRNNKDPAEDHIAIQAPHGLKPVPQEGEIGKMYAELASELLSAVHPDDITFKEANSLLKDAFKFQNQLFGLVNSSETEEAAKFPVNPLDSTTPRTDFAQFHKEFPQFNFRHVVQQLASDGYEPTNIATPATSYFKNLTEVIAQTPADVLQTYFVWTAVSTLSPYVSSSITEAWNSFAKAQENTIPVTEPVPKGQECVAFLGEGANWIGDSVAGVFIGPTGLTWTLTRLFLENKYSAEAKKLTTQIADYLKDAFLERVKSHGWISSEVKKVATKKINNLSSMIGFPSDPDVMDPLALRKYYSEVNTTSNHLENVLSLAKFAVGKRMKSLGQPWDNGRFPISPLEPGAMYDRQGNAIIIPAGFQQKPFYDVDLPSYLLYGGIGGIVGHEITHGFDSFGKHYDDTGNMTEWWDKSSTASFDKKSACFIKQYSNFSITAPNGKEVPVDGITTLPENLADAGGVAASFVAWKNWEDKKGKAKGLPGLECFTNEQLFFIQWGQNFCRNWPAAKDVVKIGDSHAPKDARIKLPLENSAAFKKAFDCPVKKPTCELW